MVLDAPPPALQDFTNTAVSFFNNHRVPAALLAATAIKDAFVLQGRKDVDADVKRSWRLVRYGYLLLMITCFYMEINVIFLSTHVGIQLANGNFKAEATSLISMLLREFEFEYVAVRFQFVTSMLAFVAAQALRVRFSLRRYADLSLSAMFCLFGAAFGMLAYNNANAITFGGYKGLLQRWAVLSFQFLLDRCRTGQPLAWLTACSAMLAIVFAGRAASVAASALAEVVLADAEGDVDEDPQQDADGDEADLRHVGA